MRVRIGLALLSASLINGAMAVRALEPADFPSQGGTSVSVVDGVATVTVRIDVLYNGIGDSPVEDWQYEDADAMAASIEGYWNAGLDRYTSECLEIRIDAVITPVPFPALSLLNLGGDRPSPPVTVPGHHVVEWASGGNYVANVPPPQTFDPYDDDGVAVPGEDFGSPWEHENHATWSSHLRTDRDYAHEFGHLLGFGDDYDGSEELAGRDGTLMGRGDLIDRNLFDRLADLIRNAGAELPECWTGTAERMRSEVIYSGGPYRCEDAWRFDFTFTEAEDGTIDGEGRAELVQDWICEPTFPDARSPSQEFDFTIGGERQGDAFDLRFSHGGTGTAGVGMAAMWNAESSEAAVTIPAADGAGSVDAAWTYEFENPDGSLVRYFTDGTIEIECTSCALDGG